MPDFNLSPAEAGRLVGHTGADDRALGERRSAERSALTGLPIVSTQPLSPAERDALRQLGRALRLAADRVDDAVAAGRVAHGLEACALAGDVGLTARRLGVTLGGKR